MELTKRVVEITPEQREALRWVEQVMRGMRLHTNGGSRPRAGSPARVGYDLAVLFSAHGRRD